MARVKEDLIVEGSNSCEDFEWEDLLGEITAYIKKVNPGGRWKAEVKNFGWRGLDGKKEEFEAKTGGDLLSAVLPNCECSFKIYKHGKSGLAIDNAHHDKPMGGELYKIVAVK